MPISSTLRWIRRAPKRLFHALLSFTTARPAVPLPYDVHLEIILWVYRCTLHSEFTLHTIRACALVCKSWTQPSQRLLFRQTYPTKPGEHARLLASLRANTQLGTYMRQTRTFLPDGFTDLIALLKLCPNITAVGLYLETFRSAPRRLVEGLRALDLRITYLNIAGAPAVVAPFIELWPGLHRLDYGGPNYEPTTLDHFVAFPQTALRSLKVEVRSRASTAWILEGADLSALRELQVLFSFKQTRRYLPEFGDALGNFTSLKFTVNGMLPTQDMLDRCTRLETLEFATCPQEMLTLPRTLRHVAYHPDLWDLDSEESRAPKRFLLDSLRELPVLRLVTVSECAYNLGVVTELIRVCEEMRVEFAVYLRSRGQELLSDFMDVDCI
ncbi:hypothetical protein FA95DRAFT_1607589 [Auriscalpium vulgare]|uniref:Uncharacterized protein n=1 Tax=Auriscalpium vulgare TaxID=40419 RepID=A0ACB8RMT0_9AGAM|nr:hypothetical protein FA95DRAFT_1607589 [Auriscalpium vulgare]